MGKIDSAIKYNSEFKIGKIELVEGDEYTISFKSTGGTITGIKAASGTYMKGDHVIINKAGGGRNLLSIMCLSPYT